MRLIDPWTVGWRSFRGGTLRRTYYDVMELRDARRALRRHPDPAIRDLFSQRGRPTLGRSLREHLEAAIDWLGSAQDATPDAGFSLGFFPLRTRDVHGSEIREGWLPSYPETTGYIIPTLLNYAQRTGNDELRRRALAAARWETKVQMSSGAVQGGPICPPERQVPAVFNTGQVIFGWLAAYRETGERAHLEAAVRAGRFLLDAMDDAGEYVRNLSTYAMGGAQTYNVRCSWALLELAQDADDARFRAAALRNVERVISRHQLRNGWYTDNDLTDPEYPLVHTIAYTMQGVLEVGLAEKREDFVASVARVADRLAARVASDGFLAGCWFRDWRPAVRWSCLTGSAQVAIVLYRLADETGEGRYAEKADLLLDYLLGCQSLDTPVVGGRGALAGSAPILGGYMRGGYPNWATKFLVDALLHRLDRDAGGRPAADVRLSG